VTPTTVLRPVHAWFFLWERIVPSVYRVVATGLASIATAVLLGVAGANPLIAFGLCVPAWIGLAVWQEHDERVLLPPDLEFVAALTDAVSEPPLVLTVERAHGPGRARREGWDTAAVLSTTGAPEHPLAGSFITVTRHRAAGWMRLDVVDDGPQPTWPIAERLRSAGALDVAERIHRARSASEDAEAIRAALTAAYW
jgi:hypothetical protein